MIAEAFLSCALALPVTMARNGGQRKYDVGVFQFITNHYYRYKKKTSADTGRIYMFGGDEDMLESFWKGALKTFRLTIDPTTPFDIVGLPDAVPIRRESGQVVIFMLQVTGDPWQSMKLWSEAAGLLPNGGFMVFFPQFAPYFPGIAKSRGWEKMNFNWYQMEIWKKKSFPLSGKPFQKPTIIQDNRGPYAAMEASA